MKRGLILFYSQTGQTQAALQQFAAGLAPSYHLDWYNLATEENIAFPWTMSRFFRTFAKCHFGQRREVLLTGIKIENYDLVVLGYQVWFLMPSLPIQNLLQSKKFQAVAGKPVFSLLTCRNLWYSATREVNEALQKLGARHLAQVILCEKSPPWASFVTTPRWMLTGRKNAFAFFPEAGIAELEFNKLTTLGERMGGWDLNSKTMSTFCNLDRFALRFMNWVGFGYFRLFARILRNLAPSEGLWQDSMLVVFRIGLVLLILVILPVSLTMEFALRLVGRSTAQFHQPHLARI